MPNLFLHHSVYNLKVIKKGLSKNREMFSINFFLQIYCQILSFTNDNLNANNGHLKPTKSTTNTFFVDILTTPFNPKQTEPTELISSFGHHIGRGFIFGTITVHATPCSSKNFNTGNIIANDGYTYKFPSPLTF